MSALYFSASNTQKQLFENLLGMEQIFHSAVVYMVLPVFSEYALQMINRLSQRNIYTIVYLVSDETDDNPNLSRGDMVEIIPVSPEAKLEEVLL